jgi:hypothetical protein
MRITRLDDNRFVPIVTCFKAQLLPNGEHLKLPRLNSRNERDSYDLGQPDLKELDLFLDQLRTGIDPLGQALEVTL